jgi:hypothetical protein
MPKREVLWDNKRNPELVDGERDLQLSRNCDCGTCRATQSGVGFITGGVDGEGVTIWIKSEKAYQRLRKLFELNGLHAEQ